MAKTIDQYWLSSHFETNLRASIAQELGVTIGLNQNITEIGCGSGLICQSLLDGNVISKETYVGGDISDRMLELARIRLPEITFKKWDIFNLDLPDRSQENTICIHVLQHLPEIVGPLKELTRVTKKTLCIASWFNYRDESEIKFTDEGFSNKFHVNIYSLGEFLKTIISISNEYHRHITDLSVHRYIDRIHNIYIKYAD